MNPLPGALWTMFEKALPQSIALIPSADIDCDLTGGWIVRWLHQDLGIR